MNHNTAISDHLLKKTWNLDQFMRELSAVLSCLLSSATLATNAVGVPATGAPNAPAAAAAGVPVDIDSARFKAHLISKALFANERLWLLMESGHLETLSRTDHRRRDLDIAPVVKDIWLRNGEIIFDGEFGAGYVPKTESRMTK